MTHKMDYQFPKQLFPSFYNSGSPVSVQQHCAGNWGSYSQVRLQDGSGPHSSWTFTSRHQAKGETWRHNEPVPIPLLSPQNSVLSSWKPPDPMDFREHMQNFYMDHSQDAFGCMAEILGENFTFKERKKSKNKDSIYLWRMKGFLENSKFKICHRTYSYPQLDSYSALMSDVVHTVPPVLLGALLHEELTEQRDRLLFPEEATGGALAFVPFSQSSNSRSELGCLLYPGNEALDCLKFHRVALKYHRGVSSHVDASSSEPFSFQLRGPIRQISTASLFNDCCVAVRSDYFCGVWRFSEANEPRLLQVVNTKEVGTCVSASPHVLGEVLVVSESGAANLWTVGRGMQKVRQENYNLYFNAKSSWRWCEFSAHPRVMIYADRTGAELTDFREDHALSHTLFRISNTSDCRTGERLILSRYLGDVHSFHHLITTQYSAYIMDERFPDIPMLKLDHMMQSPPMFCHTVSGSASSGPAVSGARTTKLLLGSHSSQEIRLLQYAGGRAEACSSRGPPQSLLRPRDSLKHLPVQIPHRLDTAKNRLSSPATGLTCIQKKGGRAAADDECICVLQLTETGDIFYQILEHEHADGSQPPALEDDPSPQEASQTAERLQPDSQLVASDTRSDERVMEPTGDLTGQTFVAETPERGLRTFGIYSDSSSEDSEAAGKAQTLKQLKLQVVVIDPELDQVSGLEERGGSKTKACNADGPGTVGEKVSGSSNSSHVTTIKISNSAVITWKRWLQKLTQRIHTERPGPRCLQQMTTETSGLLDLSGGGGSDPTDEERVQSLRFDLKACMSQRSLLLHSTVSAPFRAPDVVPLPNQVDTDRWTDSLSQRLTLSWQGEEAWKAWWADEMGLNRKEKEDALRRKRRERKARRASARRLDLLGSFTSSVSYQSELDNFSDSTAFSLPPSQGVWSDTEDTASQVEGFGKHWTPRAVTPMTLLTDTPVPSQTLTPQRCEDERGDQQTPSRSRTLSSPLSSKRASTPTCQREDKRPAKDYLSSLLAHQDEPFQHDRHSLEDGSTVRSPPPLPVASSTSSQLHSSQSTPLRSLKVDLSQSQSQSSQGRLGLSRASQPKKKRTKMGF